MQPMWLVNGKEDHVLASDRGLAYGDGLFETMAAHGGQVPWLEYHLDRLHRDCDRLSIDCPNRNSLRREIAAICPGQGRAVVKLIVTRGGVARGYRPPKASKPTRVLSVHPWPDYPDSNYRRGINLALCETVIGENPALAGMKHLCRLEQVLGQSEFDPVSVQEGLQLSMSGEVVGGTMSNLFFVQRDNLTTPRLDRYGVLGVMRSIVIETTRRYSLQVEERVCTVADVERADEIFMTNAVFGIWPVREFRGRLFPRGPVTRRLMREIQPHASE